MTDAIIDERYKQYLDFKIGQLVIGTGDSPMIGYIIKMTDDVVWINTGAINDHKVEANGRAWFRAVTFEDIEKFNKQQEGEGNHDFWR